MKFLDWEMKTWVDGERGSYPIRTYQLDRVPWLFVNITGHEDRAGQWRGRCLLFGQYLGLVPMGDLDCTVAAYETGVKRVRDEFLVIGKGD